VDLDGVEQQSEGPKLLFCMRHTH